MDVLKTAILQYITTAEKGETLKDVGEYLLLIASLLVCIVMTCSCMLILKQFRISQTSHRRVLIY